ncbi:hypothetical protein [Streptomyces sp. NBC_00443]|uniref:hypothetical protein n=1 Tax=Streptomyces sp. NBC_00443 TaxID=2975743 RepID=UPI002E1D9B09
MPAQDGAATSVRCATSPQPTGVGGGLLRELRRQPLVAGADEAEWRTGAQTPGVLSYAVDPEATARLWEVGERLWEVGERLWEVGERLTA